MRPRRYCGGIAAKTALAALAGAFTASSAQAHLVSTGLGPLYDGIGHFWLSPEDAIPVLALALLAGQQGAQAGRRLVFLIPISWFVAGCIGICLPQLAMETSPRMMAAIAISLLVPGLMVAAAASLPRWVVLVAATLFPALHGFAYGQSLRGGDLLAAASSLLGSGASVFLCVLLATAGVIALRIMWCRVAVRVLGSWIAAAGLLLLGWSLRSAG